MNKNGAKADFICDVCGKVITDYPLAKDPPRCCGQEMRRIYSVNVIYKGDGWTGAGKEKR